MRELTPTDADPHFLPRPAAVVDNHNDEITALLAFGPKLIYHHDHISGLHRLCIPSLVVLEIIAIVHDESHPGFAQCYEIVSCSWYICSLIKLLRAFIRHCPQCLQLQTRRHPSYGSFQLIHSPPALFHTLTLDFLLALCKRLNLVTTRLRRRGDAQRERKKLRVQGYTERSRIDQGQIRLTKGGLREKSCDEVWPRVDREQSPAMMFA